jgi:ATP-dependent DNA helicase RecG
LAGLRSNGKIQPLPVLHVNKYTVCGVDMVIVMVHPSDLPPVRYKGQVWIRVGPRKAAASEQEERILSEKRTAGARSGDAFPISDATLGDLSLPLFAAYRQTVVDPELIANNHRTMEDQLASLRFYDPRKNCPTVAGILLFGANPCFFLPGAYVQYLRLPGTTLTDLPDDAAQISGDLLSVMSNLITRINTNIQATLMRVSVLQERTVFNYPEIAVRELLMNAIMHRDYNSNTPVRFYWFEDRIEIQSPGGLYGEVTKETLTERNSYRNPIIAEAMHSLGYVNRYGHGIQRAQAALKENGNPPAEFDTRDHVFLAVIRRRAA